MSSTQFKKETLEMLDVMIQHAEDGPSGFWVEDHEGCGNPKIFEEFAQGLKTGRLIQKQHYICPWNTGVLYGEGHGNIHTGCYHSCSNRDAWYLPTETLRAVLCRFRKKLNAGKYDELDHLKPLLTPEEQALIQKRKEKEDEKREHDWQKKKEEKKRKAKELTSKYSGNSDIQSLIEAYYGDNIIVAAEKGPIDFSPKRMKDVVSSKPITYDEYLDIQIQSWGKSRSWLEMCYYNLPSEFKGKIETKGNGKICFKKIFVTGMYPDDCSFFDGKEEHVWMDAKGFEKFHIGDCVSFYADVYRYVKIGHGKVLDYGLRNPQNIEKIDEYQLPSDRQIAQQQINAIICESCYLSENCNHMQCLRNPEEVKVLRNQMIDMVKNSKE